MRLLAVNRYMLSIYIDIYIYLVYIYCLYIVTMWQASKVHVDGKAAMYSHKSCWRWHLGLVNDAGKSRLYKIVKQASEQRHFSQEQKQCMLHIAS